MAYMHNAWFLTKGVFKGRGKLKLFPVFITGVVDTNDKFTFGVQDTGDKCIASVNDTGDKFITGVNDTGGKLF